MRLLLSVTTITGCILFGYSQGYQPLGAQSSALAHASVTIQNAEAYFHNPGAIPQTHEKSLCVGYFNPFLLNDFATHFFAGNLKVNHGAFAFGGSFSGSSVFRHSKVGLGYALLLTDQFSMGIQLNMQQLTLSEYYGRLTTLTAACGGRLELSDQWAIGYSVFNLGRTKLSAFQDDRLSTVLRLGTAYKTSESVEMSLECFKEVAEMMSIRSGLRYQFSKQFQIGLGVGVRPTLFAFGIHYKKRFCTASLTSQYHQRLGWSPVLSISIDW